MWRRSVESWQAWRHETSEIVGVRRDSLRGSCSSWRRRLCGHARPICPICPICPILTNGHSRLTPRRIRSTRLQGCAHIRTRISWDLDRRRPGARRRARRHLQRQPAKCASNRSRRPGVGSGQPRAQALSTPNGFVVVSIFGDGETSTLTAIRTESGCIATLAFAPPT